MINILEFILGMILGLTIGLTIGTIILSRKRFIVNVNKETGETTIEQIDRPKKKVEFISEPTKKEVEEAERPEGLGKFFKTFVKPAKNEDEEEAEEEI